MITMQIRGIDGLRRRMNRIEKNIKGAKRQMLQEFGKKGKQYAREIIEGNEAVASGTLLRSIHYRVTEDYLNIFTDAPHAMFLEFGVKPHWVHGGMISPAGYSVWDWANMKMKRPVWRFMADGKNTKGIHFMENAYSRLLGEAKSIVEKYEEMIVK